MPTHPRVDLVIQGAVGDVAWPLGSVVRVPLEDARHAWRLEALAREGDAAYLLIWNAGRRLPHPDAVAAVIADGADLAHTGLTCRTGAMLQDLAYVAFDWTMIDVPATQQAGSWYASFDACLIRRDLLTALGGIDPAFQTLEGAALDLGRRALRAGAIVEHRPELVTDGAGAQRRLLHRADLYAFVLRHHGTAWARYVAARRGLAHLSLPLELRALARARASCAANPAHAAPPAPVWYARDSRVGLPAAPRVSAIIPTLGRYPYLPEALASLRRQTVRPLEVIVVDQNPTEARQPAVYAGYDDLHLRVIWQDERGQSLARNTGIEAAAGDFVFLFDDDSIAFDDLVERHLEALADGRFSVSTGVAVPPPPAAQELPLRHRHPQVSHMLDTGNCLLSTAIAKAVGGLDRNYDFGPGTDLDFGTRLFLAGYRIAHTPSAVRIHYKAPMGGLRVHGARRYNTDAAVLAPYPPVTQSYYALRYLSRRQRAERALLQFVTAKIPPELRRAGAPPFRRLAAAATFALMFLALPVKLRRSRDAARGLLRHGPRVQDFARKTP